MQRVTKITIIVQISTFISVSVVASANAKYYWTVYQAFTHARQIKSNQIYLLKQTYHIYSWV